MSKSAANDSEGYENANRSAETNPGTPVTEAEWERLRAPFSRNAYIVKPRASGRTEKALPAEEADQEEGSYTDTTKRAVADL